MCGMNHSVERFARWERELGIFGISDEHERPFI